MEESTEAHMETDVSSTTEDVPETQEVTGSDGNVEMVIVVEKVKEEEINTDVQNENQTLLDNGNTQEVSKSNVESSQVDTEVQVVPSKPPITVIEVESSNKTEPALKLVNKALVLDSEIELPTQLQQTGDVDSSIKDTLPLENVDMPKSVEKSPNTNQEESIVISPSKDLSSNPVQISPTKESQINDTITSTPIKEPLLIEGIVNIDKILNSDTDNDSQDTISSIIPINVTIEREFSNDSQVETNSIETNYSEASEKEHNKSISRELKSLINSAKESKIISECTQLKSKTRKSRSALDAPGTGLNSSVEADKIHSTRRHSNNSQKSNCSEKSEKVAVKRSMRSQNPEFVSKVKQFLNSVTGKGHKGSDDENDEVEDKYSKEKGVNKEKNRHLESSISPSKIKKVESPVPDNAGKLRSDPYCWRCHWVVDQSTPMACTVCPRSFHYKCLSSSEKNKIDTQKSWVCPECLIILQAESSETRSQAMKKMSLGKLSELLKYALERMMDHNGVEPFLQPVDRASFPDYDKYIVHPVDLSLMQANIAEGLYGSTAAFLAEAQWILHNSIIFNTLQSKLTAGARALVRSCRTEMGEIEACPECYSAAHARKPTWFTDVCTTPHILLWAKLKGFPYWPAKGMSVSGAGHVDVRFFGAHDRAWVPSKDCFLYSEKDPNNFRTKRQDIIDSMQEAEQHIRNISRKYGKFVYPPFKTQFNPNRLNEQLKMMIPSFEGEVRTSIKDKSNTSPATKEKNRSNSKSSKSSFNDGDTSENEDSHETENLNENEQSVTVASRKMADGAEIAREDEDTTVENLEIIDVDDTSKVSEPTTRSNGLPSQSIILQMSGSYEQPSQSNKVNESSRKRRRSDLEEAVITIMDSSINTPEPKRKKIEHEREKKKPEEKEPSNSSEVHQNYTSKKNGEATKKDEVTSKDNDVSSNSRTDSDNDKNQRVTPIRIALVPKDSRHNLRTKTAKESMAKILNPTKEKDRDRDNDKTTPKYKHSKVDKSPREDRLSRSEKRRNSRNKSLTHTPKSDKTRRHSAEKKSEKGAKSENETTSHKDNSKESKDSVTETSIYIPIPSKEKSSETEKSVKDKHSSPKPNAVTVTPVKDRLQYDDDTSLAVIARESQTVVISNNTMGLPTISCVRSLSTTAQNTGTTVTRSTSNAKTSDVTFTINSDSGLLIPTSSDNAKSIKEAASCKLQKLRNDTDNLVGRVGVRAFARMTSPEKTNKNDSVEIEIKAEPIDVDDADRQIEKLNLMNAFRLRPVNPINTTSNLREVRINKVLVTPLNAKKTTPKTVEVKPRAKKSFPQPKKPEDGQLNSKNSMVYIPIQPPMTQAPVRPQRIVTGPTCIQPIVRPSLSSSMSTNSQVNTVTTPVMQVSCISSPSASASSTNSSATLALGSVPTSVHTVPLMTSVNGQWMFSFQPIMSVGVDNSQSPPIVNGVAERGNNTSNLLSLPGNSTHNQQLQISSCLGNTSGPLASRPATSRTPGETNTPGEPPRLQQRPAILLLNPLDPNAPIGSPPTPSCAGPLSAKLNQNAVKLTDFFRNLLEDSLEKLEEPASLLTIARLQLEQAKWKHETEIKEIKHNQELTLAEMRALFEKEKVRLVAEARRTAQLELEAAVKLAKSKQWCANCSQEAQFYCCWNTSYCDYPCQRAHWSQHFNVCAQQRQDGSNTNEPPTPTETRLQPQPDNMPKNSSAPALTVGGKLAPSRVYTQDPNNTQKNAIIVSMVEDPSGNQTMKCVGTYKSSVPAQNMAPIIINKQIRNSEETANKKVVSSGGYLIVGSGSNSAPVVTSARRTNTIQF